MKKVITLVFVFAFLNLAQSHEFWLQPSKYRYAVGEAMTIDFKVGENFTGESWDLKRHTVEQVQLVNASGVKKLESTVQKTKSKNLTTVLDKPGTYVIGLESNFAYLELEADKFNEYLKEDGLENILELRKKENTLDKPSREFYKRYAKLMVQAGPVADDTYKKRLGFRYEIMPLTNPYTLKPGDYLDCRVMWENKPVPHTLVKVWNYVGNRTFLQNIYTENDGTIRFPISTSGPWMVSAVKMIPSERDGAEYQSQWASLVFGITK